MLKVMKYCVSTDKFGLTLKPNNYTKDCESRRSVTGYCVFVNNAPVGMKSKMQEAVTLSVTEAELVAATA